MNRMTRKGDSLFFEIVIQDKGWARRPAFMARAYSQDLRDRVIDAVLLEGVSRRSAAIRFGVSESSAIKWLQGVTRDDRRHPVGTGGHRPSMVAPERAWLFAAIEAKPDSTLLMLCQGLLDERGVRVDPGMLSRFFKKAGISFKKNRIRQRAGSA